MIDPQKKARDADRDAAVEVVEAAFADGQISRPDYDLRADRVLRAATVGELQMLVQDLRRPDDVVAEPVSASRVTIPAVNTNAIKLVMVALVAVLGLGLAAPLVMFAGGEVQDSVVATEVEGVDPPDLTSAQGFNQLVREVETKTGSARVFSAVVYPGYAVIEVPVDANSQRSFGWYYDGAWQEWTGTGKRDEERLDLGRIGGRTVKTLVRKVRRRIDEPSSSYVIVNSQGREEGVCLSAYASNEYNETAYLDARCDGTVVRTYVS